VSNFRLVQIFEDGHLLQPPPPPPPARARPASPGVLTGERSRAPGAARRGRSAAGSTPC
jgi:hypothetical protein